MPPSPLFNPSPSLSAAVINDLANPSLSLKDIASAHNTSVNALSAWMARPEIQAELAAIGNAAALRARLAGASVLTLALDPLTTILRDFNAGRDDAAARPTPESRESRRRHAETARRAASLVVRIARFDFIATPRSSLSQPTATPAAPHRAHDRAGEPTALSISRATQPLARPAAPASPIAAPSAPSSSTPSRGAGVPPALYSPSIDTAPTTTAPRSLTASTLDLSPANLDTRPTRRPSLLAAAAGGSRPP